MRGRSLTPRAGRGASEESSSLTAVGETADNDAILQWVRSAHAVPLASDLVPGTTVQQRTYLAVAGGLVASLVPRQQVTAWPEALQGWLANAPKPPRRVTESLSRAIRHDPDLFAHVYCALVAGRQRRRLGTFFTPRPLVEFMLDNVTGAEDRATLVDPGAGVGAFALAAAARWPSVSVVAVDVNIVTLGMLGGTFFPIGQGNDVLSRLTYITPHAWFMRGLSEISGGAQWTAALPSAGALLVIALVLGLAAWFMLQRRLTR